MICVLSFGDVLNSRDYIEKHGLRLTPKPVIPAMDKGYDQYSTAVLEMAIDNEYDIWIVTHHPWDDMRQRPVLEWIAHHLSEAGFPVKICRPVNVVDDAFAALFRELNLVWPEPTEDDRPAWPAAWKALYENPDIITVRDILPQILKDSTP